MHDGIFAISYVIATEKFLTDRNRLEDSFCHSAFCLDYFGDRIHDFYFIMYICATLFNIICIYGFYYY